MTADDVLGWDLMLHDLAPGALARAATTSCWARPASTTRRRAGPRSRPWPATAAGGDGPIPVVCLFDHEEVGSTSDRGAGSSLLPTVLERLGAGPGRRPATPPPGPGPLGVPVGRHGARHPPQLRRPPRARPPGRPQRRAGAQGQRQRRATPPTRPASPSWPWPPSRPGCRCSASPCAATCRAGPRSARSPPPGSASPPSTSACAQLAMHAARELRRQPRPRGLPGAAGRLPGAGLSQPAHGCSAANSRRAAAHVRGPKVRWGRPAARAAGAAAASSRHGIDAGSTP